MTDFTKAATAITNAPRADDPLFQGRVVVVEGLDSGAEVVIEPRGVTVGAGAGCELRLTDDRVSRKHLHMMMEGEGFRVRDLGSTNGTFHEGARFDDILAQPGTTLQLGRSVLQLVAAPEHLPIPPSDQPSFGALLGESLVMREVFGILERVADTNTPVLVEGETGTGKELVARALHGHSSRSDGPMVVFDCSAVPPNLVESEIFGHVRGAFTGAVSDRAGAFERANHGVLFLDELGELPPELQPKLLRVLESREVRRVGGDKVKRVDARIVAATNRQLDDMVAEGSFRADLYYRLAVVHVVLPPLRDHKSDLPLLVSRFLQDLGVSAPGPIEGPNLQLLSGYTWPGNVRELRNVLERAVACAGGLSVPFTSLPIHLGRRRGKKRAPERNDAVDISVPFHSAKEQVVERFERAYLTALLDAVNGSVTEASRQSGINRRHLYDLLKKHGMKR